MTHEDGSDAIHLRYESYRMSEGKYSLHGLPCMFGSEEEAETLEIVMYDRITTLRYTCFTGCFMTWM